MREKKITRVGEVRIYDPAVSNMEPIQAIGWEFEGFTPQEFRAYVVEWAGSILDTQRQKPVPMPESETE